MPNLDGTWNNQSASFNLLLYDSKCGRCGEYLEWEADFNAEGTSHYAKCCNVFYGIHPSIFVVSVEIENED